MAFLRRNRRETGEAGEGTPPAGLPVADVTTDLPAPDDWLPFADEPSDAAAPPDQVRAAEWLPAGIETVEEQAPQPLPIPESPPPPAADDLPERLDEIEEQLAAAQRERADGSPDEAQAVAESYRALQQSVHRLRTRLDHEASEQRGTIV